jgi:glycosyltransferase involved in cell wall biosynthesis
VRLGVYVDLVYRRDAEGLSADRAFLHFVTGLTERIDELVLFGRLDPVPGRAPYALPAERLRFVPLPHYGSVANVRGLISALRGSRRLVAAELDGLDAIWLFGPHPAAALFARMARRRGLPVLLGVRQDFPRYVGNRLPGRRWLWALAAAHALERDFRRLARRAPAVVVGDALAHGYRKGAPVLSTGFSLVRSSQVAGREQALRNWDAGPTVLSVGRLDPEKNPLLLPEILAGLLARDPRWRLVVAGAGPLASDVAGRAGELGVADRLELLGNVPNGPLLDAHYRAAHVFLHVSLTEGVPQVLFEAHAHGLPVVATDVGGVRVALRDGSTGLLTPAGDPGAAVDALERIRLEPELRERLVEAGLASARTETLEAQLDRVLQFARASLRL